MHEYKRKEDIVRAFSLVTIYIPRQEYILGSSASIQGGNWNITDNLPILYTPNKIIYSFNFKDVISRDSYLILFKEGRV